MELSIFRNNSREPDREMHCMCERPPPKVVITEDWLSLFIEKNNDGTRNLRLKGNELQYRVRRRILNEDMKIVANLIAKNPLLVAIDLSYNPINHIGMKTLVERALKQPNNIQALNFTGCDLNQQAFEKLVTALPWLIHLQTLKLTGNKIGSKAGDSIYKLMTVLNLHELDMGDTDQNVASIPFFSAALRSDVGGNGSLRILDLSNIIPMSRFYQMQPTNICLHLHTMLAMNNVLVELHLQKCGLDGHCVELLLIGLTKNTTLLLLDLGFNRIGNFGAENLANYFRGEPQLIGLNVAGNDIGELGARALSFGVPFSKLRLLDISQNTINDQGLSEILLSIKKIQRIRLFYIFGNEIGPLSTEILERQLIADVYDQSNIDFKLYKNADDETKFGRQRVNNYKHHLYNQLEYDEVRELRIRRNQLMGTYCAAHAKLNFAGYDRVQSPPCVADMQYTPAYDEEWLRRYCERRDAQRAEATVSADDTSSVFLAITATEDVSGPGTTIEAIQHPKKKPGADWRLRASLSVSSNDIEVVTSDYEVHHDVFEVVSETAAYRDRDMPSITY